MQEITELHLKVGHRTLGGSSSLFAPDYLLNIIQLIQRLNRSKIIHIQIEYLIANLAKYRVIQLEEVELHTASVLTDFR